MSLDFSSRKRLGKAKRGVKEGFLVFGFGLWSFVVLAHGVNAVRQRPKTKDQKPNIETL
jgi:hypothetical protein